MSSPKTRGENIVPSQLENEDGCLNVDFVVHVKPQEELCVQQSVHTRLRTNGKYLRECIFKRDNGVCVVCNEDTKLIAKKANQLILNKKFDELKNLLKEKDISLKENMEKIWRWVMGC